MRYEAPLADIQFILNDVLKAPTQLRALPRCAEVDADLMRQVLDESGKFVGAVGAQWADGRVTMCLTEAHAGSDLVLARLPDAPPGPKGRSLFLVPKRCRCRPWRTGCCPNLTCVWPSSRRGSRELRMLRPFLS